jgi:ribosomal protein S18 acetylase RimI-like enzyme
MCFFMSISIIECDISEILLIKSLWEGLREYHASLSEKASSSKTFEQRERELKEKVIDGGQIQILIAFDEANQTYVGYSVSTISKQNVGELDSLFIMEAYRSQGIGELFMNRSMGWFEENNIERMLMYVSYFNESAVRFYKKFDFEPVSYILTKTKQS